MSDILKHIEGYERFKGVSSAAQSSSDARRVQVRPSGSDREGQARALLANLGAIPSRAVQKMRSNGLPIPSAADFNLYGIDQSQLEASLLKLQSYESLMQLLEQGSQLGVFRVQGDKVLLDASTEQGQKSTVLSYDVTETIKRTALALKTREAAPLIQKLAPGSGQAVMASIAEKGTLPQFVRVADQKGQPPPLLKEGTGGPLTSLRQKLAEFIRPHDVLATAAELGQQAVLMVVGEPIRMSDGQYVPVEAVEAEAQALLGERLNQMGQSGRVALIRADQAIPMPLPSVFKDAPPVTQDGDETLPSASRIELAYRLIKGMSLDADEGEPLEASMRMELERAIGSDFSGVPLHTGPVAQWITDTLAARAVTSDKHVFIPREQVSDQAGRGSQTLMHELVHVKQAIQGETGRPRTELESEARQAETIAMNGSNMALPTKTQPIMPMPGIATEEGVFMAQKHEHGTSSAPKDRHKKLELLEEETLRKLQEQFHEERIRMQEELRDRVF